MKSFLEVWVTDVSAWQSVPLDPAGIGQTLLRRALSRLLGDPPESLSFTVAGSGKPVLSEKHSMPWIDFSISQSENVVAVAVASGCRVGVDIRRLNAQPETPTQIPFTRDLTPWEITTLKRHPESSRALSALRIWALKEAYAKLHGESLALDLRRIEIAWDFLTLDGKKDSVQLENREIRLGPGLHNLAIAFRPFSKETLSPAVRLSTPSKTRLLHRSLSFDHPAQDLF